MRFDAVFFDLDGTLIDSAACIVASFELACRAHDLPVPSPSRIRASMGIPLEISIPAAAREAGRELDAERTGRVIATYREHYARLTPDLVRVFPGVPEMLDALRERGVPMAIVTSKRSAPAEMNLRHVGLLDHFAAIVGSDHVTNYKPHPETVHVAAARLGVTDMPRTLVVGDAPFDIEMGRAAGSATCAALWGAHDVGQLAGSDHVAGSPVEVQHVVVIGPVTPSRA